MFPSPTQKRVRFKESVTLEQMQRIGMGSFFEKRVINRETLQFCDCTLSKDKILADGWIIPTEFLESADEPRRGPPHPLTKIFQDQNLVV